ncbi:MAG TPA: LPS-assembly protein LptD, partial [Flavisolibacter sp.]|nr:LPS-assembly protein LptD [Flavisolibacter sp.]
TLFEKISLTAQGNLNPYKDTAGVLVDQYVWQGDRFSLGTLTSASIALSTRFQSKPRDPKQTANTSAPVSNRYLNDPLLADDRARLEDYIRRNPAEFVDFNIPWSFDISYSLTYNRVYKYDVKRYAKELNSNISFSNSFSLTPKWIFTTNGYFDFDTKQLTQFTMSISRDMHCWQMSVSVVPINVYKYFNITISPKSTILQDLRVNRTRSFSSY